MLLLSQASRVNRAAECNGTIDSDRNCRFESSICILALFRVRIPCYIDRGPAFTAKSICWPDHFRSGLQTRQAYASVISEEYPPLKVDPQMALTHIRDRMCDVLACSQDKQYVYLDEHVNEVLQRVS